MKGHMPPYALHSFATKPKIESRCHADLQKNVLGSNL